MRSIVWSAVLAAALGIAAIGAAVLGGPHDLVLAFSACGVIAAVLNINN